MKVFLNKIIEDKKYIEIYKNDVKLQESIKLYKNNNFKYIIEIDEEIDTLLNNI